MLSTEFQECASNLQLANMTITHCMSEIRAVRGRIDLDQKNDALVKMMLGEWTREYHSTIDLQKKIMLSSILKMAHLLGIRYLSISAIELHQFEIVTYNDEPAVRHIARIIEPNIKSFNGNQAQLYAKPIHTFLHDADIGLYDLRGVFTRIGPPLPNSYGYVDPLVEKPVPDDEDARETWFAKIRERT